MPIPTSVSRLRRLTDRPCGTGRFQMKHKIEITETLQRVIEVEASTVEDAERAALGLHRSGEVVLSADDFVSAEVKCVQER